MNTRQRNKWVEDAKEQVLRNARLESGCEAELMMLYDECAAGLETEIRAFFNKYAKENSLSETEAAKLLSGKEYSRWRKTSESYLKEISEAAPGSKLELEFNTLRAKSNISRKEKLLSEIYYRMAKTAGKQEAELEDLLKDIVITNYERKSYAIQSIGGAFFNVGRIDEDLLKSILSYPWSGDRFSKRLWDNTDKLAALARRELTLGFMSGASVEKIAGEIDDVMQRGRYPAQRLVRTEASYFSNAGQMLAYKEAGIEEYEYIGGGCEICAALGGHTFRVEDAEAGVNLPPMHPNCKCTTVAKTGAGVFKMRYSDPLKSNPRFEEWKKKYMRDPDETDDNLADAVKGILKSGDNRKKVKSVFAPCADKVKVNADVDLKNSRRAATEIKRQLEKMNIDKLDSVEIFDNSGNKRKMASASEKKIVISNALLNDPKAYFKGSVTNWKNKAEKLAQSYPEYSLLPLYKRGNVFYEGRTIECVIQHEMMHVLLNVKGLRDDKRLKECYNRAVASGDIFEISHRAAYNEREFAAEASIMYENGEPLPRYIETIIKELRKNETQ